MKRATGSGMRPEALPPGPAGRHNPAMIVLFTDFGPAGPYVGQMKAQEAAKEAREAAREAAEEAREAAREGGG